MKSFEQCAMRTESKFLAEGSFADACHHRRTGHEKKNKPWQDTTAQKKALLIFADSRLSRNIFHYQGRIRL